MYRSAMLENIGIRTKTARSVGFSRSENLRNAMEFDVGNYFDFVGHMSGFCSGFSYFLERFYGENIQIELFVGNCIIFFEFVIKYYVHVTSNYYLLMALAHINKSNVHALHIS